MRYIIQPGVRLAKIRPEIYGNFSEHLGRCIYEGVFVGKDSPIPNVNGMRCDVVNALKEMKLPVLRWPGGCFADEYHWMDGIGENRKKMINNHWGGVVEDNSFGTHEFMELCRQIGCEPYITGNVGSGEVREMQEWVEYMTSPDISPMADLRRKNGQDEPWHLKYFGIGNENWGCGGNMTAEFYADVYRRYQTYVRNYGDNKIYKVACGPGTSIGKPDYHWTKVLMEKAGRCMNGLSLHYYTVPGEDWRHKGSSTEFTKEQYLDTVAKAAFMETLVKNHGAIMDLYDPEKKIGLIVDEWGTWYDVEPGTNPGFLYMQDTMRDAMVAGLTLNIFNKHADRVHMANIAQLINVLQAVMLTEGERSVRTPTYHAFRLFREHQGADLVQSCIDSPTAEAAGVTYPVVSESASVDADGRITVTLVNTDPENAAPISMRVDGFGGKLESAEILTGDMHAYNDFDAPDRVLPVKAEGITLKHQGGSTELSFELPAVSILTLRMK